MRETGITFSADMVKAIQAGEKTMTRRLVMHPEQFELDEDDGDCFRFSHHPTCGGYCDYACASEGEALDGHIGWTPWGTSPANRHRLWVKEVWAERSDVNRVEEPEKAKRYVLYKADGDGIRNAFHGYDGWRSSRYMPRLYARVILEITAIRVERVQSISRGDCMSEGCPFPNLNGKTVGKTDPVAWYKQKWNEINGKGSWELNPWVFVIEFKVVPQ